MLIFIDEFGGLGVYGWGDGDSDSVGGGCSANGEAAMFGDTNMSEPFSPVDYVHTHHAADLYGAVTELELVCVCPSYGLAMAKY